MTEEGRQETKRILNKEFRMKKPHSIQYTPSR